MDEQWNGCLASTEAATIYISRSFLQPRMLEPVSGAGNFSPVVMPVCLVCLGSEGPDASFGPTSHKTSMSTPFFLHKSVAILQAHLVCVERLNNTHPFKLQESLISFPDTDVPGGSIHSVKLINIFSNRKSWCKLLPRQKKSYLNLLKTQSPRANRLTENSCTGRK